MFRGAGCALRRFVLEWYFVNWIMSRVYSFGSHIHCFFLLLLLFAFRWSDG